MPDREKVIGGLETIGYSLRQMNLGLLADSCDDAIALLKEHEPKTVQVIGNVGVSDVKFADCPWCSMRIHDDESQYYCGHCGQAVKWE